MVAGGTERRRICLYGAVQGVGFRPFVYRLAHELGLRGWVLNCASGLIVEVEGIPAKLADFAYRIEAEKPAPAMVLAREEVVLPLVGFEGFEIRESESEGLVAAGVLPDLATCPQCLSEVLDSDNRRYGYPFTNCTLCGPRYTIVLEIPYDRPNTTMRGFTMCPECRREYEDPENRRFHAQPNACPVCGPALESALEEAAKLLAEGQIVALKGIGGFQLLADANNELAVSELRRRKHREEKPFAVMMPDLNTVRSYCLVSDAEAEALMGAAAPIVLLEPASEKRLAPNVCMRSPWVGVMLPYSPLHHLLMRSFPHPVVATSGNRTEEPIAIDNGEARERLSAIADRLVLHNRPVARPCDDSVVRFSRGRPALLRRARGYAPLPLRVPDPLPRVLAVGAHLKNTVALGMGRQVVVSQHIGDLDSLESRQAFEHTIEDLCRLYRFEPEFIACDLHPDYASTIWARQRGLPLVSVQHHHAHLAACAAENEVRGPYLGVCWDGTGYGLDGTIWGGEIFVVEGGTFQRVSHLRTFPLPGGEAAVREGWRCAISVLTECGIRDWDPGESEMRVNSVRTMLARRVNATLTSSVGRLFDAVAALTGVARHNHFEGQAAMLLEAVRAPLVLQAYPILLQGGKADWRGLIEAVLVGVRHGIPASRISALFHNALLEWITSVAEEVRIHQVLLSGGVFQNRYLTEGACQRLERKGFRVYTHQLVPPNDGGIALGQAVLGSLLHRAGKTSSSM